MLSSAATRVPGCNVSGSNTRPTRCPRALAVAGQQRYGLWVGEQVSEVGGIAAGGPLRVTVAVVDPGVLVEQTVEGLSGRTVMTRQEVAQVVDALGDMLAVLQDADAADRADIYRKLNLRLTYQPARKAINAEVKAGESCRNLCQEQDFDARYLIVLRSELALT
jgi:hypothetical protein